MKNISKHISYKEATYSNYAKKHKIENKPNDEQIVFSKDTAAVVYIGKVVKIQQLMIKRVTNLHRQFTILVMLSM